MTTTFTLKRLFHGAGFSMLCALAASAAAAQEAPENFTLHQAPRPLPDLSFEDASGQAISLSDFRDKVVLLNIWATWCAPCRREMPTLDRLQAQLGGPDFEVVALSIDRAGLGVVREFYHEIGIEHLAMYIDSSGKAAQDLGVVGLPMTLLIDRNSREFGRLIGPAEWDTPEMVAFIRKYLAHPFDGTTRAALGGAVTAEANWHGHLRLRHRVAYTPAARD